jgi:hypothetical protein
VIAAAAAVVVVMMTMMIVVVMIMMMPLTSMTILKIATGLKCFHLRPDSDFFPKYACP